MADYPKIGSATIVRDQEGDTILLGVRGKDPNRGKWIMPGGKIELGETIDAAAVREVREETGLEVRLVDRLGIFEIVGPGDHTVFVLSEAVVTGGALQAGDDLTEVRWFHRIELPGVDLSPPCRMALEEMGWITDLGQRVSPVGGGGSSRG